MINLSCIFNSTFRLGFQLETTFLERLYREKRDTSKAKQRERERERDRDRDRDRNGGRDNDIQILQRLQQIELVCGLSRDVLSKQFVKKSFKFSPVHQDNVWKVNIVKELLAIKFNKVDTFTNAELDLIMSFLCTD